MSGWDGDSLLTGEDGIGIKRCDRERMRRGWDVMGTRTGKHRDSVGWDQGGWGCGEGARCGTVLGVPVCRAAGAAGHGSAGHGSARRDTPRASRRSAAQRGPGTAALSPPRRSPARPGPARPSPPPARQVGRAAGTGPRWGRRERGGMRGDARGGRERGRSGAGGPGRGEAVRPLPAEPPWRCS